MCTNAMSIARRHLSIIVRLCDMSEQEAPVGELVRATVKNCLLAMQATGTEAQRGGRDHRAIAAA
ncbi:hypothetical protein J2S30_000806 [Herbaspirillum rubrisubalbicans]|uniref:hypothetical protein n=1 Tax=Herbaspirillum rubrisubalbicans TaxID=80842 RepID=UPI00209D9C77|nr:hypothetical protein [Herbaspirillum rubrisubalbicans]MCP1572427.1 hypothetical protein [Herbaspirillum rubrisubalbicans]